MSLLFLSNAVFAIAIPSDGEQWQARLTPVPLSFSMRETITGLGQASAQLRDGKLIVKGSFNGLQGAATVAKIHHGPKAMAGPAIIELTLIKEGDGKQGTLSGELSLTEDQLSALASESLYIQIYSDVAKDGNLRGWLLPKENN